MALIELYEGNNQHPFAHVRDSAVPRENEYINIQKQTWQVERVTWALDHSDKAPPEKELRACVVLKPMQEQD